MVGGIEMSKPYWYLTTINECPICGRQEVVKERMYTEKPVNPEDRFIFIQIYDWCMER